MLPDRDRQLAAFEEWLVVGIKNPAEAPPHIQVGSNGFLDFGLTVANEQGPASTPVPPEEPDGTPQQIHFDLDVEGVSATHAEPKSLSQRLLRPAGEPTSTEGFQMVA